MTPIDRFWLLTWTCYGTWLPGDKRGFVSPRPDGHGELVLHNIPGTPYDEDEPELERMTRSRLAGPPISLNQAQSDALHAQFQ